MRRWPLIFLLALTGASAPFLLPAQVGNPTPSGCTSIADVPVTSPIQYAAAIQHNIFQDFNGMAQGCADCHTSSMGTQVPAGNLDLDPSETSPYVNLVGAQVPGFPGLYYVVPGHPEQSLLFWKVNCDYPGVGERMPLGGYGGGLSAAQQAVIYDWIAAGAPIGTTDQLFRGTFDIRGLNQ